MLSFFNIKPNVNLHVKGSYRKWQITFDELHSMTPSCRTHTIIAVLDYHSQVTHSQMIENEKGGTEHHPGDKRNAYLQSQTPW